MLNIKFEIEKIADIIIKITETARDVNRLSVNRKEITQKSLVQIESLIKANHIINLNFKKVFENLNDSLLGIASNSSEFKKNVEFFSEIIRNIKEIREILKGLDAEIGKLTIIVDEIKEDTDEIFTLALNASIVSSKYSSASDVFDILANKLNGMSNFINQNLASIVDVVRPITEGILEMINKNGIVLKDIEDGYGSFIMFPDILDHQKESIDELLLRAYMSGTKIEDQQKMLEEMNSKVNQMLSDSDGAINGSGNVIKTGESLFSVTSEAAALIKSDKDYMNKISVISEKSKFVWQNAQAVNQKSRSQLDFSISCVEFSDSIIAESAELKKTTAVFNRQSVDNNKIADSISSNLIDLTGQLKLIEEKIEDSNRTMSKFNDDYKQIDNILEFLKNILKTMNVIGMLSRIESAREPEEYQGFMTISENIRKLQDHIHINLPKIEKNIGVTHEIIEQVNSYFEKTSSVFFTIAESSNNIINSMKGIINISLESEEISRTILGESNQIDSILKDLRSGLLDLTEIVKKPIDGSAANIERGKNLEEICGKIIGEGKQA